MPSEAIKKQVSTCKPCSMTSLLQWNLGNVWHLPEKQAIHYGHEMRRDEMRWFEGSFDLKTNWGHSNMRCKRYRGTVICQPMINWWLGLVVGPGGLHGLDSWWESCKPPTNDRFPEITNPSWRWDGFKMMCSWRFLGSLRTWFDMIQEWCDIVNWCNILKHGDSACVHENMMGCGAVVMMSDDMIWKYLEGPKQTPLLPGVSSIFWLNQKCSGQTKCCWRKAESLKKKQSCKVCSLWTLLCIECS